MADPWEMPIYPADVYINTESGAVWLNEPVYLQTDVEMARRAVEAAHTRERDSLCAEITRLLKGDPDTEVLQAVLDAVKGTLDPHSQIADHPNVKFVQMELLKLRGSR